MESIACELPKTKKQKQIQNSKEQLQKGRSQSQEKIIINHARRQVFRKIIFIISYDNFLQGISFL